MYYWVLAYLFYFFLQTKEFIKVCVDNGVYDFDTAYMYVYNYIPECLDLKLGLTRPLT